jgi:NADH:ubiquinone oxidoreductase subunit 2 (subunit N)
MVKKILNFFSKIEIINLLINCRDKVSVQRGQILHEYKKIYNGNCKNNYKMFFAINNFTSFQESYFILTFSEIISFLGFLISILIVGGFYSKYRDEVKKNVIDVVKYNVIIEKMFFFFRCLLLFLVIFLFNPVGWSQINIYSENTFLSYIFLYLIKIFLLLLFYYIIKYLRYKINKYYIISIESFVILSCLFFCNFLLISSNHLLITLVLFEILFFCFLPLLSHSHILCNTNILYNSPGLVNTLNNYRTLDIINKEQKFLQQNNEGNNVKVEAERILKYKKYTYSDLMTFFFHQKIFLKKYNYSLYSTITYFFYNVFFASLYIIGTIIFLFFSDGLSFFSVLKLSNEYGGLLIFNLAAILILNMFCFKMGIFPFHGWLLNVFANTNYFILMLLTIPFKLIVFYTFFRLFSLFSFFDDYLIISKTFICFGLLSIIYGAVGLFSQLNVRKFLAYSTIHHSGYILVSLSINTLNGFFSSIIYIVIYLVSTLGFFYFISGFRQKSTGRTIVNFAELAGGVEKQKYLYMLFSILLLSMAGMPPLGGFWAKFFVLRALLDYSMFGFFVLLIILVTTGIAFVGYLRIIKIFFYTNIKLNKMKFEVFSENLLWPLIFICFFLVISVFFILIPEYLFIKFGYYLLYLF